jgi:hypothetical protein
MYRKPRFDDPFDPLTVEPLSTIPRDETEGAPTAGQAALLERSGVGWLHGRLHKQKKQA